MASAPLHVALSYGEAVFAITEPRARVKTVLPPAILLDVSLGQRAQRLAACQPRGGDDALVGLATPGAQSTEPQDDAR